MIFLDSIRFDLDAPHVPTIYTALRSPIQFLSYFRRKNVFLLATKIQNQLATTLICNNSRNDHKKTQLHFHTSPPPLTLLPPPNIPPHQKISPTTSPHLLLFPLLLPHTIFHQFNNPHCLKLHIPSTPSSSNRERPHLSTFLITPPQELVSGSGGIEDEGEKKEGELLRGCDLYDGKWVKDEEGGNYPIYQPGSCPYVDEAFDCQKNGRADSEYLKWRWKPHGCELPRFSSASFLERLRGKKLMLVGDSMNRNQFESLLCMLWEGLSNKSKMYEVHGFKITKGRGYFVFKFEDYNCSVVFVRSHFLVKEGIRINGQGKSNPTLSIDIIDKSANRWKGADILVFNTGHWWTHGKTARGKNYYKEGDNIYPFFDAVEAYRRAMKTWAKWIDENISPEKLVIYRGYSSAHFRGGDWDSGGSCNGETEPVLRGAILDSYPLKMKIVDEVIKEMKFPVVLLNVTKLTNFRKDGHPSIYGKTLIKGKKVSTRRQDCSHWCLPGVPDAWNELVLASLVVHQTSTAA